MLLTHRLTRTNIALPLPNVRAGIETPRRGQKRPLLSTVVFLCPLKSDTGLIRILSVMVGCIEQPVKRLAVPLSGSLNLIQSTAQELRLKAGGLYSNKGHKPMLTRAQNQHKISVSEIKKQSLQKQHDIIGHALDIFCTDPSQSNRSALKNDALELLRMLDDLSNDLPIKTSRFNVLDKAKNTIATFVPFDVAMQHKEQSTCTIKYAGMEVSA